MCHPPHETVSAFYQLNRSVCISTSGVCAITLTPVCSWKRTNGGKTFIRKSCLNTPGGRTYRSMRKTGTDSQRGGFVKMESGGSLVCHQVSCSHLWLWLYGLDCRCFLVTGADTAGQLNTDRRGGWWWEGGASSLWDPPLLDTENQAGRGRASPTWMKSLKKKKRRF